MSIVRISRGGCSDVERRGLHALQVAANCDDGISCQLARTSISRWCLPDPRLWSDCDRDRDWPR